MGPTQNRTAHKQELADIRIKEKNKKKEDILKVKEKKEKEKETIILPQAPAFDNFTAMLNEFMIKREGAEKWKTLDFGKRQAYYLQSADLF